MTIKHLSIGVNEPNRAAEAMSELTRGNVRPFSPVKGAYVCLWPDWNGQFDVLYYVASDHVRGNVLIELGNRVTVGSEKGKDGKLSS